MFRKYILPALAVIGVAYGVVTVIRGAKPRDVAQPVAMPAQSPFGDQIAGSGLVEANTENIAIGTLVSGVVVEVPGFEGHHVKKGDVLFRLDDRDLQAQRKVMEAELQSAQRKLEKLKLAPRPEDIPPLQAKVDEMKAAAADMESQYQRAVELKDTRAIAQEELTRRQHAMEIAKAQLAQAATTLAEMKAGTWKPDLQIADADVENAKANLEAVETNIERLVVRSPIDGTVLQRNVRVGEFAQAGAASTAPLMVVGNVEPLYVRVDVDENDAWRVVGQPDAVGEVRGNRDYRAKLKFVRVEPYVIPKKSLTGDTTERVDTRVLQIIYSLEGAKIPIYAGQQMDVFIDAKSGSREVQGPGASPAASASGLSASARTRGH
jgi:multidrug efflux pump subunit AcrA (membrane-fusion protein)